MESLAIKESKRKEKFVAEYLSPLLRAAGINVAKAEYIKDQDTGEEVVIITHVNGYTRERCVTADSLIALTRDTIEGL